MYHADWSPTANTLQHITTHCNSRCNTLQHIATHTATVLAMLSVSCGLVANSCSFLPSTFAMYVCVAVCCSVSSVCCSMLQRVAACCSVLQRVAVCCSVSFRLVASSCTFLPSTFAMYVCVAVWVQRVLVCCNALQCVAVYYNVLQCAAMCCSVLQPVAACCSVLQCASLFCPPPSLCMRI